MSGDFAAKVMELPASRPDDELPRVNENPGSCVLAQDISPSSPDDDYTTADIRTLLHRLYALASQI